MKKLIIIPVLLVFIVASCSKDSGTVINFEEVLKEKKWLRTSWTVSNQSGTTDLLAVQQPYKKDDLYIFGSAGQLVIDEGPTKKTGE